jgi:hypothetical protein
MNQIRLKAALQLVDLVNGAARPESIERGAPARHVKYVRIITPVQQHIMAMTTQQRNLGIDHGIFAASVMIGIVRYKNLHGLMLGAGVKRCAEAAQADPRNPVLCGSDFPF